MTKKKRDYAKAKHVGVSDILNLAVKYILEGNPDISDTELRISFL